MYGQSCRVLARWGVRPLRFGGASLCWGRSVTFHSHRSVGIPQVRWMDLVRQYIALPRPWLQLRMESSVSRDLRSHVPQRWGSSGSRETRVRGNPGYHQSSIQAANPSVPTKRTTRKASSKG